MIKIEPVPRTWKTDRQTDSKDADLFSLSVSNIY